MEAILVTTQTLKALRELPLFLLALILVGAAMYLVVVKVDKFLTKKGYKSEGPTDW